MNVRMTVRRDVFAGCDGASGRERPNPPGLHRVTVREISRARMRIGPIEAIDGTPVVDLKPVLDDSREG